MIAPLHSFVMSIYTRIAKPVFCLYPVGEIARGTGSAGLGLFTPSGAPSSRAVSSLVLSPQLLLSPSLPNTEVTWVPRVARVMD